MAAKIQSGVAKMLMSRTKPIWLMLALAAILTGAGKSLAQRPGGGQPGRFRGGPGPGPQLEAVFGAMELLRRPDIRKELELLDSQIQDLETAAEQMRERVREEMEPFRDLDAAARRQQLPQAFARLRQDIDDALSKVLLPHQMKRLGQLEMQQRMRRFGLMGAFQGQLTEKLQITDEQREQLRAKAEKLEVEMREKIAEIRRQAQQELMDVLTPQQQAMIQDLLGDPFEFEPPQRPDNNRPPREQP
jgi:hypothetical protein